MKIKHHKRGEKTSGLDSATAYDPGSALLKEDDETSY